MPIRIQRSRKKGWTIPPNTKVVTRPGRFGNPFYIKSQAAWGPAPSEFECATAAEAVQKFEDIVCPVPEIRALIVRELRGFDLCCWCKLGQPCHADVLLRIANS